MKSAALNSFYVWRFSNCMVARLCRLPVCSPFRFVASFSSVRAKSPHKVFVFSSFLGSRLKVFMETRTRETSFQQQKNAYEQRRDNVKWRIYLLWWSVGRRNIHATYFDNVNCALLVNQWAIESCYDSTENRRWKNRLESQSYDKSITENGL